MMMIFVCLGSLIDINQNNICDATEICPSFSGPIVLNADGPSSLTVSWSAPAGVSGFELEYRVAGSMNWTQVTTLNPLAFINGLTSCTDYEFRAKPICAVGQPATYSPIYTFQTTDCFVCTAPIGLYQFNIQNISAIITWDVLVGATSYTYHFRPIGSPNWISQSTTFPIAVLFGISGCTDYEWTMDATCFDGTSAQSPTISTFSTVCKDGFESKDKLPLKFSVYPNPSSDILQLSGFDKADIRIYNLNGELILEMYDYSQNEIINTKSMSPGIYYIEVNSEKGSQIMSIVKK